MVIDIVGFNATLRGFDEQRRFGSGKLQVVVLGGDKLIDKHKD